MSGETEKEGAGSPLFPFRDERRADKGLSEDELALRWHRRAETLPGDKGAYILLIRLAVSVPAPPSLGPGGSLRRGLYLYCGSARGPGGIRARVGRHMRAEKGIRWHVDHLTTRAASVRALVFPGGEECALLARVLGMEGVSVPLPGLGASDCATCPAHLLRAEGTAQGVAKGVLDLFPAVPRAPEEG
ncbi:MAG: GIY-YIG nuclease family protein [Rhodospirillum sp.]|nr:GIY-YIG nuclease family protein [Rhodospirillum sp.]MCF8490490.1 GIY-YIG nuclease family protein [Rhodospirillum sp.]MCF8500096.1 GIY-YIG nuclease family protein [Rhodospirillum sp.]